MSSGRTRSPRRPWPSPSRSSAGTAARRRRSGRAAPARARRTPRRGRAGAAEPGRTPRRGAPRRGEGRSGRPGSRRAARRRRPRARAVVEPSERSLVDHASLPHDPPHLGAQHPVRHGPLGVVDQLVPVDLATTQPALERAERRLASRVGEHPVDEGERVVAGGALAGPGLVQLLARLEDLLDEHVGAAGQVGEVGQVALAGRAGRRGGRRGGRRRGPRRTSAGSRRATRRTRRGPRPGSPPGC